MSKPKQKAAQARRDWRQIDALRLGTNWSEEDLEKLQILVDDVWGDSHPGSYHLDGLSDEAAIGVWESGGKPSHFHVTDLCDGWAMGHSGMNFILPSREVITDMVELHASVLPWDGAIFISSCDKSIPAHLRAAARVNIPAIHVPGGSMRSGPDISTSGKATETSMLSKRGEISDADVRRFTLTGCPTCGSCQFMGTASTMQCMSEALGMALPASALMPSTFQEIKRHAREAGKVVMQLVEEGITPADILTKESFVNAIRVHAAISGSTNALLHLPAIGKELGIAIEPELFDEANRVVPYLTSIQPSGEYVTEFLWFAGGVPRIQWEIRDLLDLDVLTVTGETLKQNLEDLEKDGHFERAEGFLANYGLKREDVIRSADGAESKGSIAVLRGNLAPEGSVVKYSAVHPMMMQHCGPARVFDSEEAAHDALISGRIAPGAVFIIRYEGPRGSGMPELLMTTGALVGMPELASTTALVTDGRFSGASAGPCIGHVSPEAISGGPIALVQENDLIEIDIPDRNLNIVGVGGKRKSPNEMARVLEERKRKWKPPELSPKTGVLKRYCESAESAMKGGYVA